MSRITHTHASRGLAVAGLLVAASLVLPEIGLAQEVAPERALLNHVPVTAGAPASLSALLHASADLPVVSGISGEQALLGRTSPLAWSVRFDSLATPLPRRRLVIDGEAALLGKRD